MYPTELDIKDTTESNTSASFLDLLLSTRRDGQLRTSLYDKLDYLNVCITNFPFLSKNIPYSPLQMLYLCRSSHDKQESNQLTHRMNMFCSEGDATFM